MKPITCLASSVSLSLAALLGTHLHAQSILVDMDPGTTGIQSSLWASPGDSITVALVLDLGASFPDGLSIYGFSVRHDTGELDVTGATEGVFPGLANLTVGLETISDDYPASSGDGEVNTFEGYTMGSGPTGGSSVVGTITYTVSSAADDGLADVVPALWNVGVDGFFDNSSSDISGAFSFSPGYVVPEPREFALMAGLLCAGAAWLRRRAQPH